MLMQKHQPALDPDRDFENAQERVVGGNCGGLLSASKFVCADQSTGSDVLALRPL